MPPDISVVVATHDRPESLATLVRSLAQQMLDRSRYEVIVVDDGSRSPDDVRAAVGSSDGLDVRLLRHEQPRGPAAARNTGWRDARAPVVAFTDDDCRATPGWLEGLLAAGDGSDAPIVQGRVEPDPEQRDDLRPLSHTLEVTGLTPFFMTCNCAYPRRLLERIGGFDEWFRHACGEDVDLGARAVKAGGRPVFADDALVYHEVRSLTLRQSLRHTLKWTDSVRTLRLHPELREALVARLFWKPTHVWLLLALAGAATGIRRRHPLPALLAALPYLRHYARLYAGRRRLGVAALPRHVLIDLCEIWTAVSGSVEHRTLML